MMAFLTKYFKEILVFLFAIILLKKFDGSSVKEFLNSQEDLDSSETYEDSSATLTDAYATLIADNIYKATALANGSFGGTDETLLYQQFDKMKNQHDFNKVYNEFGKRQYSTFWGNAGDPLFSERHDLISILSNELTDEEQNYLTESYPHLEVFGQ